MPCCGRANNRRQKSVNKEGYYDRYTYLNSHQRARQQQQSSNCKNCAALTVGDPCAVCGQVKNQEKEAV